METLDFSSAKINRTPVQQESELAVQKIDPSSSIPEIRISVIGNVDSGKSSLIGTLIRGKNDNGRGENREFVMNYPHEKESGQTSSIGYQLLGFKSDGTSICIDNKNKKETWPLIMKEASKIITFIDLAGHEKFLKTTVNGLSNSKSDYALVIIEGKGIRGMTREHIMLCLALNIPFIIIITKTDLYKTLVSNTILQISKALEKAKKSIIMVNDLSDAKFYLTCPNSNFIPVIQVSNVTGYNIDLLKSFLYLLPMRIDYSKYENDPLEMSVIEKFSVQGIGTVAHCFITRGQVKLNDIVWVGPDKAGMFFKSKIKSIHYKRIPVKFCLTGHHVCIVLPGIDKKLLKNGVVVLSNDIERYYVKEFKATIKIVNHSTTIQRGYCPILNIDNIKLAAKIIDISDAGGNSLEYLRSGDKAIVKFRFLNRVSYIRKDEPFIFRDGLSKGIGEIIDIEKKY